MATPPTSPTLGPSRRVVPREQLVQLIVGMLRKKGESMAAELEKRIDAKQPLQVKGFKVDVPMLEEALNMWDSEQGGPPTAKAAASQRAAAATTSSSSTAPAAGTVPGTATAAGARWMPSAPSASSLAARALTECEQAETFSRSVRVVGGTVVPVYAKPDVLSEPLKETVKSGQEVEVVARFMSPKDGRVYLRLKAQAGWISTRSPTDFAKVVAQPVGSGQPLEPQRCGETLESTALELLHTVAGSAAVLTGEGITVRTGGALDEDLDNDDVPQQDASGGAAAAGTAGWGSDDGEGEEEEDFAEDDEVEDELDGEGGQRPKSPLAPKSPGGSASAAAAVVTRKVQEKRFKVCVSRIPVLSVPCSDQLMGTGHMVALEHNEEFVADGACFIPAENRVYLRLRGNRGWVAERSRNDIRRLAAVPITRRKQKLSKKMAKAVAFRGGDTDGVTRLKREDLVRNSSGKIVSKRASEAAKKRFADSGASKWVQAVKRARQEMGVTGFCPVKKGTPVYDKAREIYATIGGGKDPVPDKAAK